MELKEEMVSQETVYNGIIVNVRRDKARLLDGRITNREVVEHPGGVAVFAIDQDNNVILVRQYRYPMGEVVLELPAGKLEKGEDPRDSGLRSWPRRLVWSRRRSSLWDAAIPLPVFYPKSSTCFLPKTWSRAPFIPTTENFWKLSVFPMTSSWIWFAGARFRMARPWPVFLRPPFFWRSRTTKQRRETI